MVIIGMVLRTQEIHGRMARSTSHSVPFNQDQTSPTKSYFLTRKEPSGGMLTASGHVPVFMVP
jgi:hypothetical protein